MMVYAQTERLILREIVPADEPMMFELDSDESVHRYTGTKPLMRIQQTRRTISRIRQQYWENGIGRWAIIEKQTNNFVGWAGLRFVNYEINNHTNFYDLAFRLLKQYWGKGIATEAANACLEYGFDTVGIPEVYSMADCDNWTSHHVLNKLGFTLIEQFDYENKPHHWFRLQELDWKQSFE